MMRSNGDLVLSARGNGTTALWLAGNAIMSADQSSSRAPWTRPVRLSGVPRTSFPLTIDLTSDARGNMAAAWAYRYQSGRKSGYRVRGALRSVDQPWQSPVTLADFAFSPGGGQETTVDVELGADGRGVVVYMDKLGGVSARTVAVGASGWGRPVPIRTGTVETGNAFDVAVAVTTGGATAAWRHPEEKTVSTSDLTGRGWSEPRALPNSRDGFEPRLVATAAGEAIALWTTNENAYSAASSTSSGRWSAPTRHRRDSVQRIASRAGVTAMTGIDGKGRPQVLLRRDRTNRWKSSRPPVPSNQIAIDADGSIVAAGRTSGGPIGWSRLPRGAARWTPARIVSDAARVEDVALLGLVAHRSLGSPPTAVWNGSGAPRRLGRAPFRSLVESAFLDSRNGIAAGSRTRLRIETTGEPVATNSLIGLVPFYQRFAGPVPVAAQVLSNGSWRTVTRARLDADENRNALVRMTTTGRQQLRLRFGPGLRQVSNVLSVDVRDPAFQRIVAGLSPEEIAVDGADLWVVSSYAQGRELRLLDSDSGQLRAGPVALPRRTRSLIRLGEGLLIDLGSESTGRPKLRLLDASRPALLGAEVEVAAEPEFCPPDCGPIRYSAGGRGFDVSRLAGDSLERYSRVASADGVVWLAEFDESDVFMTKRRLIQRNNLGAGAPIDRGPIGDFDSFDGTPRLIAARDGVWIQNNQNRVFWAASSGTGVELRGRYGAISMGGQDLWALRRAGTGDYTLDLLDGAQPQPRRSVAVGKLRFVSAFSAGDRAAWFIEGSEGTLVRVPVSTGP